MGELHIPNVAILASGGGTTAEAYAQAIHEGLVQAEITLVVSSKKDAGILNKVAHWNKDWGFDTETAVINKFTHPDGPQNRGQTTEESQGILQLVKRNNCDLIACLGYMIIVSGALIEEYGYIDGKHESKFEARMLNTHPGPLPLTADTFGVKTSALVLAAYREGKITESRHTVHMVSSGVDAGPKVAEHPVPIEPNDTAESLNNRTQIVEKATIAYAIDKFLKDQLAYFDGEA